jgi:N-methylhydantoinase A
MSYIVGVDIGGTFTDCVVFGDDGAVTTAKAPSTPGNFAQGMIDAIGLASEKLGLKNGEIFDQITHLAHGTTVGTNAVVQKKGASVGLITTKGHNDVLHIMRGSRGFSGRDIRKVVHFPEGGKPEPLIPKRLIEGVSERVDCFGAVVVRLNETEARAAIQRLLDAGVEAIAICFLWSFLHPDHERRVREMVEEMAPGMFVTCSADLVPKWGEYERTAAVALNAYIGPLTAGYLKNLNANLTDLGYAHPLQITQCGGGTIVVDRAMSSPLLTLDSGPVSGVTGSAYLGKVMGISNVITTDMGGTSFDVGIIHDGQPIYSSVSTVNQYEYFIPKVDIQAIGSGGGSMVTVDEITGTMRVGPESAGAVPGPVCYGKGGTVPTVTDAAVVLGYLNPENFADGRLPLDKPAAEKAVGDLAQKLSMSTVECASGIATIAEFQMADIIRKMTVGKGFDPRDFVLFAFGGAGPVHAGVFAHELGVQKVVIPQREMASTWCAFGAASADVLHVYEQVNIMATPFDADSINKPLGELGAQARDQLLKDGIGEDRQSIQYSIDMRHKGQINEVEVVLDWDQADGDFEAPLRQKFYDRYEQLYGRGSSFHGARVEAVTFRARASAEMPRPILSRSDAMVAVVPAGAIRPSRPVYWSETKEFADTLVYDGQELVPGNVVAGPAIVETPDTTVVVRPGQRLLVDPWINFELDLGA